MKVVMRTYDTRFLDPRWDGGIATRLPENPYAEDGKKTVIIHGKRITYDSPRSRWPHAELWGVTRCNVLYWGETLTDWTRWFDLHPLHPTPFHRGILAKRPQAWDWYTRQRGGRPIYLLETHPDVPDSVAFPRAALQATYGTQFMTSADWLIALALEEGFERIVLNGIGMRHEADFQYAHQGIWHWIGYARGVLGWTNVVIEGASCYQPPQKVYGYEAAAPSLDKESACLAVK